MNFLITGAAGFIGFHISSKLLNLGNKVIGIDNINSYYDVNLKKNRLKILNKSKNFKFIKCNINSLKNIKISNDFIIIHLAAQAGIKLSENNRELYFQNNIKGFNSVIEFAKVNNIKYLFYASSSSVYSGNKKTPNSEGDILSKEKNFYATTKKINEVIANYHSNKNFIIVGLRFFTVYGPFGRPDMAIHSFTKKIIEKKYIYLNNYGNYERDFTYIDDAVKIVIKLINSILKNKRINNYHFIYNIGFGKKYKVIDILRVLEKILKIDANYKMLPKNKFETTVTLSDPKKILKVYPDIKLTSIDIGLNSFVNWYIKYFKNIK